MKGKKLTQLIMFGMSKARAHSVRMKEGKAQKKGAGRPAPRYPLRLQK